MYLIIELLFEDPGRYVMIVGLVIVSIVLHELGHAYTATWQGDSTPRMLGHLTWNPLKHMGWFSLAMVAVLGIGFGATPVRPRSFRNKRWGSLLVSVAGPAVNLLLAAAAAGVLVLMGSPSADQDMRTLWEFWAIGLQFNVMLFLFNMFPLPPFDGFTVLDGIVPLGDLKHWLRSKHPVPMLLAFAFVVYGPFWEFAHAVEALLVGGWAHVFALLG